MTKFHYVLTVCFLTGVLLATGCGDNYGDVEAVLETQIDVMSEFVADMDKAKDADAVVAAINNYSSGMEKLIPQLKEIVQKYPNIKAKEDISADLKEKLSHLDELSGKFQGSMVKTSRYMPNKDVQKAWEDFGRVMSEMNESQI